MQKWKISDVVLSLLTILILFIISELLINSFPQVEVFFKNRPTLAALTIFLLQAGVIFVAVYIFGIFKYNAKFADLGFAKISPKLTILLFVKGYLIWLTISYIVAVIIIHTGISIPGYQVQAPTLPLFGEGKVALAAAFFAAVLIAPVIEEMYFRGFVLQATSNRFGQKYGSLMTALLFATIHLQFQSIVPLFILGLILNYIFLKGKSLWPCILFHAFNNGLALLIEFFVVKSV